jgi:hypothetical protein
MSIKEIEDIYYDKPVVKVRLTSMNEQEQRVEVIPVNSKRPSSNVCPAMNCVLVLDNSSIDERCLYEWNKGILVSSFQGSVTGFTYCLEENKGAAMAALLVKARNLAHQELTATMEIATRYKTTAEAIQIVLETVMKEKSDATT